MHAWIIKSETYDPDEALEIVQDQRIKGYTAWIEDEQGKIVDEKSLRMNGRPATRPLLERLMGPLVVVASVVVGIVVLLLIGLWGDR
jgi:hypothetical protein